MASAARKTRGCGEKKDRLYIDALCAYVCHSQRSQTPRDPHPPTPTYLLPLPLSPYAHPCICAVTRCALRVAPASHAVGHPSALAIATVVNAEVTVMDRSKVWVHACGAGAVQQLHRHTAPRRPRTPGPSLLPVPAPPPAVWEALPSSSRAGARRKKPPSCTPEPKLQIRSQPPVQTSNSAQYSISSAHSRPAAHLPTLRPTRHGMPSASLQPANRKRRAVPPPSNSESITAMPRSHRHGAPRLRRLR